MSSSDCSISAPGEGEAAGRADLRPLPTALEGGLRACGDGDGDAEPFGDRPRGQFAVGEQVRGADPVCVAQVARGSAIEWFAGAGAVSGRVQCGGQFRVGQPTADFTGQGGRLRRGAGRESPAVSNADG